MTINEKSEISKLIIEYALSKYQKVFATCSFGKDSRVLIDLAKQVKPDIQFIGIDTGYEFPETLSFARRLIKETGMNFYWAKPTTAEIKKIDSDYGDFFIKDGRYKCCAMKIPVIKKLKSQYDAWITGLRRDETADRKNINIIETGEIIKINPLAFWTKDEIWQYLKEKKLSYHPLYDQGYSSLGCQPCTKKSDAQDERAGRFTDSPLPNKECGLHSPEK